MDRQQSDNAKKKRVTGCWLTNNKNKRGQTVDSDVGEVEKAVKAVVALSHRDT